MKNYNGEELIVRSTGEIIDDVGMIISKKEIERNENYKKMEQRAKKILGDYENFYFLIFKDREIFKQNIKDENVVRLIYLATYMDYDGYLKTQKKNFIKKSDLKDLLSLSNETFYNFYNEMEGLEVFKVEKDGNIRINNDNFKKGVLKKNDEGTRIFIRTIRELYKNTPAKEHKQLGIAFKTLPYINYKFNILCKNPQENDSEKIEPLTLRDVCEICGIDRKRVRRMLKSLMSFSFKYKDKEFGLFGYLLTNTDFYNGKIILNPLVSYRGSKNDYEIAILLFGRSERDKFVIKEKNEKI